MMAGYFESIDPAWENKGSKGWESIDPAWETSSKRGRRGRGRSQAPEPVDDDILSPPRTPAPIILRAPSLRELSSPDPSSSSSSGEHGHTTTTRTVVTPVGEGTGNSLLMGGGLGGQKGEWAGSYVRPDGSVTTFHPPGRRPSNTQDLDYATDEDIARAQVPVDAPDTAASSSGKPGRTPDPSSGKTSEKPETRTRLDDGFGNDAQFDTPPSYPIPGPGEPTPPMTGYAAGGFVKPRAPDDDDDVYSSTAPAWTKDSYAAALGLADADQSQGYAQGGPVEPAGTKFRRILAHNRRRFGLHETQQRTGYAEGGLVEDNENTDPSIYEQPVSTGYQPQDAPLSVQDEGVVLKRREELPKTERQTETPKRQKTIHDETQDSMSPVGLLQGEAPEPSPVTSTLQDPDFNERLAQRVRRHAAQQPAATDEPPSADSNIVKLLGMAAQRGAENVGSAVGRGASAVGHSVADTASDLGRSVSGAYGSMKERLAAYVRGDNALPPQQTEQLIRDKEASNPDASHNDNLQSVFDDFMSQYKHDDAGKFVQSLRQPYEQARAVSQAALAHDNIDASLQAFEHAHNLLPNDTNLTLTRERDGAIRATVAERGGDAQTLLLTPKQYSDWIHSSGSQFDHLGDLGTKGSLGKATPNADTRQPAVYEPPGTSLDDWRQTRESMDRLWPRANNGNTGYNPPTSAPQPRAPRTYTGPQGEERTGPNRAPAPRTGAPAARDRRSELDGDTSGGGLTHYASSTGYAGSMTPTLPPEIANARAEVRMPERRPSSVPEAPDYSHAPLPGPSGRPFTPNFNPGLTRPPVQSGPPKSNAPGSAAPAPFQAGSDDPLYNQPPSYPRPDQFGMAAYPGGLRTHRTEDPRQLALVGPDGKVVAYHSANQPLTADEAAGKYRSYNEVNLKERLRKGDPVAVAGLRYGGIDYNKPLPPPQPATAESMAAAKAEMIKSGMIKPDQPSSITQTFADEKDPKVRQSLINQQGLTQRAQEAARGRAELAALRQMTVREQEAQRNYRAKLKDAPEKIRPEEMDAEEKLARLTAQQLGQQGGQPVAPQPDASSATRKTINGVTYVWDGRGWTAQ